MKLSQVISKLEERGLHKSAENVRKMIKGQAIKKDQVEEKIAMLESVIEDWEDLLEETLSDFTGHMITGSLPKEFRLIKDFIKKEKVSLVLEKLHKLFLRALKSKTIFKE